MHGERAARPRERVIENARAVPVVEGHERARGERAREAPVERRGVRRDLGGLAGRERDRRRPPRCARQRRRRRRRDPDEAPPPWTPTRSSCRPSLEPSTRTTGSASKSSFEKIQPRTEPAPQLLGRGQQARRRGEAARGRACRRPRADRSTAVSRTRPAAAGSGPARERRVEIREERARRRRRLRRSRAGRRRAAPCPRRNCRAIAAANAGETVGDVTKSPRFADRGAARVVARRPVVERRLHEVAEGDRALAGDSLAETLGREAGDTLLDYIFAVARRRLLALAAAASLARRIVRLAPRGPPLPTLEDYSDGVSVFAEQLLEDWKAGAADPGLYADGLRVARPAAGRRAREGADAAAAASSRSTGSAGNASAASSDAARAVRARLAQIRSRVRLARPHRERDLRLSPRRRAARGRLRPPPDRPRRRRRAPPGRRQGPRRPLSRAGRPRGVAPRVGGLETWLAASATEPLFEETAARAGLVERPPRLPPRTPRATSPCPGEHMPPGAAVLDFDGDGREDLFVVGGRRQPPLPQSRRRDLRGRRRDRAGVGGQPGEAVGALAFDYDNDGRTGPLRHLPRPARTSCIATAATGRSRRWARRPASR